MRVLSSKFAVGCPPSLSIDAQVSGHLTPSTSSGSELMTTRSILPPSGHKRCHLAQSVASRDLPVGAFRLTAQLPPEIGAEEL
jgi:hypothetical protein